MKNTKCNLDPYWVTGFTDAEGCFSVGIYKNNIKYIVQVNFQIELHKDIDILVEIKSFFQDVGINKKKIVL